MVSLLLQCRRAGANRGERLLTRNASKNKSTVEATLVVRLLAQSLLDVVESIVTDADARGYIVACSAAEYAHGMTRVCGGRQRVGEDLGASLGNLMLVGVGRATRARVDDNVAVTKNR